MNFLRLLEAKREGAPLSDDDLKSIVGALTAHQIPDYQLAAFLMAVYFRGLSSNETRALTLAMRDSGTVLRFPNDPRPLVDKHSTGGVGDKVSLPLAPLLAALGFRVPMISGRGLGITGGTLDKLESIPGFRTALTPDQILQQVSEIGCALCGQTAEMVPADKILYALRDVTATVPSIPLITASILSKKLAEGISGLILDVKFGAAAFMQTQAEARTLAQTMVQLGNACGVRTHAFLTFMDEPLGRSAGNWLEVREALACLDGTGPADLVHLVVELAARLMLQMNQAPNETNARQLAITALSSGRAKAKWQQMLRAQGADLEALERKGEITAQAVQELRAARDGFVVACNARVLGEVVRDLGGGRTHRDSIIDPDVGLDQLAKVGDPIKKGDLLARIHAARTEDAENAAPRVAQAIQIGDQPPETKALIAESVAG